MVQTLTIKKKSNIKIISKTDIKIRNKAESIDKIAKFLDIKKYNTEEIISGISMESTIARRQAVFDRAGVAFRERRCYRKGQVGSWRQANGVFEFVIRKK